MYACVCTFFLLSLFGRLSLSCLFHAFLFGILSLYFLLYCIFAVVLFLLSQLLLTETIFEIIIILVFYIIAYIACVRMRAGPFLTSWDGSPIQHNIMSARGSDSLRPYRLGQR